MQFKKTALVLTALALLTGACTTTNGSAGEEVAGDNRPASESPATVEDTVELPEETEEPAEDGPLAFGQTFTYEDGLSVTVSKPTPFRPSEYAAYEKRPAYRVFTVRIVNRTGKKYDPTLFTETMQSGNEEADQIFDSQKDIGGSPDTALLNGREAKFKIAFGVNDPKDMVLEISPGFEYAEAIWATS